MAKFNISGDTETGEFVVSINGEPQANVNRAAVYMYENYDDEMELHFTVESVEKAGDVRKMTMVCAAKDKIEKTVKSEIETNLEKLTKAISKRLNK